MYQFYVDFCELTKCIGQLYSILTQGCLLYGQRSGQQLCCMRQIACGYIHRCCVQEEGTGGGVYGTHTTVHACLYTYYCARMSGI